jgi:hypothetical protein
VERGYTKQDQQIQQLLKIICDQTKSYIKSKYLLYINKDENTKAMENTIIHKIFEKDIFQNLSEKELD